MEYINKIELQGRVGSIRARVINDTPMQYFSLATEYMSQQNDMTTCEITWHNVVAWDKAEVRKGDKVRVLGRMRQCNYVGSDGKNIIYYEVLASEVEVIAHEDEQTEADIRRTDVRKAMNSLMYLRMTESRLNAKLSEIFGKEITVEKGLYEEDWGGDDYFTFSVDDEVVGGYFDIYHIKTNKGNTFYITEVNIYFE